MKPGDVIDGRFVIDRLASAGGMGAVYRAHDCKTERAVAVKVLHHPSLQTGGDRFAREAEVLAQLDHPHIVGYVAHGVDETGAGYLAIEWLDGHDLEGHLELHPKLEVAESIALARDVALALGAAHALGVVHRDIKPSNLFLEGGDLARVKVLDFGVARLEGAQSNHTRTGTALGTPGYMAPEQARGEKDVDARADVFALGCVLFECISGRPVFLGDHVMAILAKVLLEEAPRLADVADVPPALDALVGRMLSKTPATRPADGHAVVALLDALDKAELEPAPERPPPPSLGAGEQRLLSVVLAHAAKDSPSHKPASAAPVADDDDDHEVASTLEPVVGESATLQRVRAELASFNAQVERLADGSLIATLTGGGGSATDQAARGARFALALRAMLPHIPMALATGRGFVVAPHEGDDAQSPAGLGRWPVGDVIDRAARLLRRDASPGAESGASAPAPRGTRPLRLGFGSPPAAIVGRIAPALGGGMMLGATNAAGGPRPIRVDDVTASLLDVRFDVGGDAGGLVLLAEREQVDATRTLLGKPTPFVGRERELSVLLGLFDECVNERVARAVVVTAPAGVGKSRLRYELLQKLAEHVSTEAGTQGETTRFEVWFGRGDPMSAGAPYSMIAPALRRAAGIYDGEPVGVRRQKLRARASRSLQGEDSGRVIEFLGELVGVPFPDDESVQLRAARQDAVLMSDQVARAWETFVDAEARAQPVVVVLEDAQWGDAPSMEILDAALRALESRPFFVIALGRPELRELFPRLWEGRAVYELRLSELTKKAAEKLVRAVLPYADDRVVGRVVSQASGNAFYLEELMRAVASGKSKLPETVLAMVEARLHALDADTRRVLRAASVFGQVTWRGGVAALVGGEAKPQLLAKLDALVDLEILARRSETRFPGQVEYAFRQSIVREAAYAMLTDADRTLGHQLAANWLESVGEVEAVVLAEHHERGGNAARAAEVFLHAAREACDANDLAGAIARADQGIACGAAGELLGHLRLVQAEAHRWRDENGLLVRCAEEATANLPPGTPAAFLALTELATGHARVGAAGALAAIGESLREEVLGPREHEKARAIARVVSFLVYAGRTELASSLVRKLDDLSTDGLPDLAALVHSARATTLLQTGDVSGSLAETRASVAMYEAIGDTRNACFQRANLGGSLVEVGHIEDALAELRAAHATAVAGKIRFVELVALLNLGLALAYQGALDDARQVLAQLVAHPSELPTTRIEGGARIYYAITCCLAGDFGAAEHAARGALPSTESTPPLHAFALGALARAELGQLKRGEALGDAEAAMALLKALGGIDAGDAFVRLTHAEVVYAAGEVERAAWLIEAARSRLLTRAERIADPAMRKTFLERVPENAATLARAAAWL